MSHDVSIEQFASGPMAAIIGQRKAEYACQTSKLFTGQEALDWGLIDQLVSPDGKIFPSVPHLSHFYNSFDFNVLIIF